MNRNGSTGRRAIRLGAAVLALAALVMASRDVRAAREEVAPGVWVSGVPSAKFEAVAAIGRQRSMNWCWAACIQMVLNYQGVPVTQEQIVERTFGARIDAPGQPIQVLANLNTWGITADGRTFVVGAESVSAIPAVAAVQLIRDLDAEQPLIIGISGYGGTGHACVVTAVQYHSGATGSTVLDAITLRDPWPGHPSRIDIPWAQVTGINFLARIRVVKADAAGAQRLHLGIVVSPNPVTGATVTAVEAGSPAAVAGVAVGDVIVALGGHAVSVPADLGAALSSLSGETQARIVIVRGGVQREGMVHFGSGELDPEQRPKRSRTKKPGSDAKWEIVDSPDVTTEAEGSELEEDEQHTVVSIKVTNDHDSDTYKVRVGAATVVVKADSGDLVKTLDMGTTTEIIAPGKSAVFKIRLKARSLRWKPSDEEHLGVSTPAADDEYKKGSIRVWRQVTEDPEDK